VKIEHSTNINEHKNEEEALRKKDEIIYELKKIINMITENQRSRRHGKN